MAAAGRKRGPAGRAAGATGASTVTAMASGPIRVYLNSAICARGSPAEGFEPGQHGRGVGAAAQPLQGLERAVVRAAQQRVRRLRLHEPRERGVGGGGELRLPGEVGGERIARGALRHRAQQRERIGVASAVEQQQAERVAGAWPHDGIAP